MAISVRVANAAMHGPFADVHISMCNISLVTSILMSAKYVIQTSHELFQCGTDYLAADDQL